MFRVRNLISGRPYSLVRGEKFRTTMIVGKWAVENYVIDI